MKKYTIGLVQLNSQDHKDENLKKMEYYIREAVEKGCQVVAFPECSNFVGEDDNAAAEDVPGGDTFSLLSRLAKRDHIWIHCGSIYEKSADIRPYNCSFMVNPEGELAGKYHKLHPFDVDITNGPHIRESDRIKPGEEIVTVDGGEYGMFGLSICYDLRFPELYRAMVLAGAEILFVPANFTMNTGKDHWEPLLRARAIENGCYVVAPAQIGVKPKFQAYGKSMIIDPWGNVISRASDREEVVLAEIDLEYVKTIRREVGMLKNRRRDHYQLRVK